MRILMLIPELFYSARGTPLSAYHRIVDLRELGHEIEVLTYPNGDAPPDPTLRVYRSFGPHFSANLRQGPSYLKIWFDLWIALSLLWRLVRSRYDVVYAHEEGGFIAALVAPLFRTPVVYDMHSSLPLQVRDWGFSQRAWVVALFRWVERFALKRARVAVSIAPGVTKAALANWSDTPIITITNRFSVATEATPVDAEALRSELNIEPHQRLVLYTGSFVALQALDLLVDSIPAVARAVDDVVFVLVGGRPKEISTLRAYAEKRGASRWLILVEFKPQEMMPVYLAAADVLASPRVEGINPPGKLFSYLSSGKPLVAVDRPIHNQILNQDCAILTEPEADTFAAGIVAALTDEERVRSVANGAKRLLETHYNPEKRAEAYAKLIRLVA